MASEANRLEARIRAVNRANAYANELSAKLKELFRPFVGQKVLKADNTLMEKYKKVLPKFTCTPNLSVYRYTSEYSLVFIVKTCEGDNNGHAYYHETSVYVGELQNGFLTKVGDEPLNLKTDYTAADITAKRQAYNAAKRLADEALSALHPFGEYDR